MIFWVDEDFFPKIQLLLNETTPKKYVYFYHHHKKRAQKLINDLFMGQKFHLITLNIALYDVNKRKRPIRDWNPSLLKFRWSRLNLLLTGWIEQWHGISISGLFGACVSATKVKCLITAKKKKAWSFKFIKKLRQKGFARFFDASRILIFHFRPFSFQMRIHVENYIQSLIASPCRIFNKSFPPKSFFFSDLTR